MSGRRVASEVGSRRRESSTLGYLPPVREPRFSARALRHIAVVACVIGWLLGTAAAATSVIAIDGAPSWTGRAGAAVLTIVYVITLTYRCGGRVALWPPLVALLVAGALVFDLNWVLSTVSVVTAVMASVLAVVITRPALSTLRVIGEFALAGLVSVSGGLAVAGWNAPVLYQRYNLVVLALAMLLTFGVVWGLGAGLHGLGRRGVLLIVGGAVLMAVILAYGTAVRTYGSPVIVNALDDSIVWMRDHIGGVPRPAQVLVGFPALVWGIGTRADRRQGWWMCAFGVVGTAVMTTQLASPQADPSYLGLSALYSLVLGLLLGLLVRRLDPTTRATEAGTGRRALRDEPATVIRPEPLRTQPLK